MSAKQTAVEARDVARFLAAYSKIYHAGAFGSPTADELAAMPFYAVDDIRVGDDRTVIIKKLLTRASTRRDFTGRMYKIPAGASVVTNIARTPSGPIPIFSQDYLFTYIEDRLLTEALWRQGWSIHAINVSAASEIIACWSKRGRALDYSEVDLKTVGKIPFDGGLDRDRILAEVDVQSDWHDDYPFYSDGSWSALNLRGFWPHDPTRGVKPAEMSKRWKAENPETLNLKCEWTDLAEHCPATIELVESVGWWAGLERVRLLRMAGRGGRGGALRRHTDITDRAAGTRDGQIARFHVALVTDPRITMTSWTHLGERVDVHLSPWECWYLDQRKPHAVSNPTGIDRIHLVIDVVVDAEVRWHIEEAMIA